MNGQLKELCRGQIWYNEKCPNIEVQGYSEQCRCKICLGEVNILQQGKKDYLDRLQLDYPIPKAMLFDKLERIAKEQKIKVT